MASNATKAAKPKLSAAENRKHIFTTMPIWKSVLKMAVPGMIQMLMMGAFMFIDSVISVHFAEDNYRDNVLLSTEGIGLHNGVQVLHSHDLVRMFMAGAAPISSLMMAVTFLFSMGVSTRVSINLGKGDIERAKKTLRTGASTSMILSFVMIPILYFVAKPWIETQYDAGVAKEMSKHAFEFAWIGIIGYPIQSFSQTISGLFRIEGRNKEMVIASIVPILINIAFDFVFMIPLHFGVAGAAWATFIANGFGALLVIFFVVRMKSDIVTFRNMYGKFTMLPLVGIILVGLAPFLRNLAQSTTQTAEASIVAKVSVSVYHNKLQMTSYFAGAMPVFMLFFPVVLAFSQASAPITSFNYGAGDTKRVKQTLVWTLIYSTIASAIIYFLSAWALARPLLAALGATGETVDKSSIIIKILMVTMPLFTIAITGMTLFGSTDRVIFSIIASTLRGFILIFPVLYMFKAIAEAHPNYEYAFWWFYPFLGFATSVISIGMMLITLRKLEYKHLTLDQRIDRINEYFNALQKYHSKLHAIKKSTPKGTERDEKIASCRSLETKRIAEISTKRRIEKEQAKAEFIAYKQARTATKLAKRA